MRHQLRDLDDRARATFEAAPGMGLVLGSALGTVVGLLVGGPAGIAAGAGVGAGAGLLAGSAIYAKVMRDAAARPHRPRGNRFDGH